MGNKIEIPAQPLPASTVPAAGSAASTALAAQPQPFVKASTSLSNFLGVEPSMMIETIKRQCFRNMNADQVSDAQLAAFVSVANALKVNPLLPGFLYAYPERNGGITPIIGPDGVFKLLSEHPGIESWETEAFPPDITLPPTHATTKIYRKGSQHPISYTALMSEWRVNSNPNWNSRPRHMLGIRALKQAARQLIHGIPFDEDERIITEAVNVTHTAEEPAAPRPAAPARARRGVAAVKETPQAPAPEPTIEVAATPVQEPAPVSEEPTPESVAANSAPEPAAAPVSQGPIAVGERRTIRVKVLSFSAITIPVKGKQTPSVKANVEGDYTGFIWHLGGARIEGDKAVADPLWKAGATVTLNVHGEKNLAGVVQPIIDSIKADEPAAEGEQF